jgi:hypothetical protein
MPRILIHFANDKSNILYNIAIMLLFDAIDTETKEHPLCNIFVITRHYKRVEIRQ